LGNGILIVILPERVYEFLLMRSILYIVPKGSLWFVNWSPSAMGDSFKTKKEAISYAHVIVNLFHPGEVLSIEIQKTDGTFLPEWNYEIDLVPSKT
jgi:hypothetical protein